MWREVQFLKNVDKFRTCTWSESKAFLLFRKLIYVRAFSCSQRFISAQFSNLNGQVFLLMNVIEKKAQSFKNMLRTFLIKKSQKNLSKHPKGVFRAWNQLKSSDIACFDKWKRLSFILR